MGTVEFMVPKEYWAKEPVGLRWLFLIDVSQEATNKGFLEAFCEGILGALYAEDQMDGSEGGQNDDKAGSKRNIPLGSKVGFVTFDKEVHFYNCNVTLVSDVFPYQSLMVTIGKFGKSANARDARYRRSVCSCGQ